MNKFVYRIVPAALAALVIIQNPQEATAQSSAWLEQGPKPIQNGTVIENVAPNNEVDGAMHTVAAHPTDPDILYVGAANGGIWRTMNATDANPNWEPLTDKLMSLSIGALEFDPANPDTLVAGIGRFSAFASFGGALSGVLLSDDAGDTWSEFADPLLVGENISGVAIRGDVILASSNFFFGGGGLFRSPDRGVTWNQIDGMGGSGLPAGSIFDLVGDPTDPMRFYASMLGTGVFRSDDGGQTWTDVSSGDAALNSIITVAANNNAEMAVAGNGRLYIGVLVNGQVQYIGFTDDMGGTWNQMDLPRTLDLGSIAITTATNATPIQITAAANHNLSTGDQVRVSGVTGNVAANGDFFATVVNATQFTLDGSAGSGAPDPNTGNFIEITGINPTPKAGGQGGTHFSIRADAGDPNTVYVGGDRQGGPRPNFIGSNTSSGALWRGDTTVAPTGTIPSPQWEHLTHLDSVAAIPGGGTASNSAPHADSREMVFDADGDLIEVDDGGIYRRTSPGDNTGDWFSLNSDMRVTEIHDLAFDSIAGIIIAATQDNGTPEQIVPDGTTWDTALGADGNDAAVDETSIPNMSVRYFGSQRLGTFRRKTCDAANVCGAPVNIALTTTTGTPLVTGTGGNVQFKTPVKLNAVDPTRMVIGGANSVYESRDGTRGDNIVEAGTIGVNRPDALAYGGRMDGMDNPDVLYVGSGNNVFVRTTPFPAALVASATYPGGNPREIVLDPDDWMTAYVIDSDQVFLTIDAGANWTDITGDLSDVDLRSIIFVPGLPGNADLILAGGRGGVFRMVTANPGVWNELGDNLPEAPAYDLDYDPVGDVVVVGTMGRGAWRLQKILEKIIASGPDIDGDGEIDVVVEVGQAVTTAYDFDINYTNLGGPDVLIVDTVPSEWQVKDVAVNLIVDGFGGGPDNNGGAGTVDVFPANNKTNNKSATKIEWTPDPSLGSSTINVWSETRGRPAKNPQRFAPTSCGPLFVNSGAAAFELDEFGEPLLQPPIFESNLLCLAAVENPGIAPGDRGPDADTDGDGLSDFGEACARPIATDPCLADSDGDSVNDDVDACPLEGPPDLLLGQILGADGCIIFP